MGVVGSRLPESITCVKQLIKDGNWEEAARYGDAVCYNGISKNENWIWAQLDQPLKGSNQWDTVTWGNCAIGAHYGAQFPNRVEQVQTLRSRLLYMASDQ